MCVIFVLQVRNKLRMLIQAYVQGRWKGKRVPKLQAYPRRVNGEWEGEVKGKIGWEGGARPQAKPR